MKGTVVYIYEGTVVYIYMKGTVVYIYMKGMILEVCFYQIFNHPRTVCFSQKAFSQAETSQESFPKRQLPKG